MFEALANWIVYDLARLQGTPLGSAPQFFMMDVSKILVLLTLVIYGRGPVCALPAACRTSGQLKAGARAEGGA